MRKDEEINIYLDKIEELEEIIMRLEALIPEEDIKKKSRKKKMMDSKLTIEQLITNNAKALKLEGLKITSFHRLQLGQ